MAFKVFHSIRKDDLEQTMNDLQVRGLAVIQVLVLPDTVYTSNTVYTIIATEIPGLIKKVKDEPANS
jgi:hypothetical protein